MTKNTLILCLCLLSMAYSNCFSAEANSSSFNGALSYPTLDTLNAADSIIEKQNSILLLAREANNKALYAKMLKVLGKTFDSLGVFDKAAEYYYLAINEFDQMEGTTAPFGHSSPWLLVDLGNSLFKLQSYKQSIRCYSQAAKIFTAENNTDAVITCTNNIGLSFTNSKQYENALSYFERAKQMGQNKQRSDIVALCNTYIGIAYAGLGKKTEAIASAKSAESFYLSTNDSANLMIVHYDIASIYEEFSMPDSAIFHYQKVRLLANQNNTLEIVLSSMLFEASCQMRQSRDHEAETLLIPMLEWNETLKKTVILTGIYEALFEIEQRKGNYQKALNYHLILSNLRDSLSQVSGMNNVVMFEYRVRADMMLKEINLLEENEKRITEEKNKQRNLTYFLVFSAVLLISVSVGSRKKLGRKVELVRDYYSNLSQNEKWITAALSAIYLVLFFIVFRTPGVSSQTSFEFKNGWLALPGVLGLLAVVIAYIIVFRLLPNLRKATSTFQVVLFGCIAFLLLSISLYFNATGLQLILLPASQIISIVMVVLASIILPFFLSLTIIEGYIIKRMAVRASQMTQNLKTLRQESSEGSITVFSTKTKDSITFRADTLVGVQAHGNYCKFFIQENRLLKTSLILIPIKKVEEILLPDKHFIRCHKSFLINISYINRILGNSRGYQIITGVLDFQVPVSRSFQSDLKNRIEELKK